MQKSNSTLTIDMKRLSRRLDDETLCPSLRGLFLDPVVDTSLQDQNIVISTKITPREVGGSVRPIREALSPNTSRGGTFNTSQDFKQVMGGYDGGFEVGLLGSWTDFQQIDKFLSDIKEKVCSGECEGVVEINGRSWVVSPSSSHIGVVYSYVLQSEGVTLFVHSSPEDVEIPLRLRFGAVALIGRDLFELYKSITDYLACIGFVLVSEKISRVDLQVMVDVLTPEFIHPVIQGCLVSKAVGSDNIYRECVSGFRTITSYTIGSDIQLCIYDKRFELEKKLLVEDPVKYQLMVDHCLGESWVVSGTPLTRVEFRLRRAALADLSINTVDDLLQRENSLVAFLTSNWFRLLKEPKKIGHSSTQSVLPIWETVQQEFDKWFPGGVENREVKFNRVKPLVCDVSHLLDIAVGCIGSAAVRSGNSDNVLSFAKDVINRYERRLEDVTQRKASLEGTRIGRGLVND